VQTENSLLALTSALAIAEVYQDNVLIMRMMPPESAQGRSGGVFFLTARFRDKFNGIVQPRLSHQAPRSYKRVIITLDKRP
jgi:hypothetical protein